jgi:hypothetical protein
MRRTGWLALGALVLLGAGYGALPIVWKNAGTPVGVPSAIDCSTNLTCSLTGGVLTMTASSGGYTLPSSTAAVLGGVVSPTCGAGNHYSSISNGTLQCSADSGGGGGYATVQDEGGALTARAIINFTGAGVACVDNAGATRTDCTISGGGGGGSPGGASGQFQANDGASGFSAVANVYNNAGWLQLNATDDPVTPTSGVILFSETRAGRPLLGWAAATGLDQYAQAALWSNGWGLTTFNGANAGKTEMGWGSAFVGTGAATTFGTGSMASSTKRATYSTGTTANTAAGVYVTSTQFWRGNSTGLGGFYCQMRWTNHVSLTTSQMFAGLQTGIAAPSGTIPVATVTSTLWAGWSSGSSTVFLCGNDASGSSTCVDCGANYPKANTTSTYALSIFAAPSSTSAALELKLLNSNVASCSSTISAVGDLPPNSVFLAPRIYGSNIGAATNFGVSPILMYCETDN